MICFVVLHYLALKETITCVDSIKNNINSNIERHILIVDNASPNNSYFDLIERYSNDSEITILKSEKNEGYARGNNIGYEYAVREYCPEFVVVMNNDMEIVQQEFVDGIIKCYKETKFDIMGPDIYSTKKKYHQNPQTRKMPTQRELKRSYLKLRIKYNLRFLLYFKWRLKKSEKKIEIKSDKGFVDHIVNNPLLHGSCYIFSVDFIKKHPNECFYNKTFMYMEAEILYYLANKNNEKVVYCPYVKVNHHEDVATDLEYKKKYKKSIFSIKCLLQSNKVFLDLMEQDNI